MDLMNRPQSEREAHRAQASREELVERMARAIREDGTVELLEGLQLRRASSPTELGHGVSYPAFCVIAQGSKEILLGDNRYRYDPAHYLITTAALPVAVGSPRRQRSDHIWASSSGSIPPSSARSWARPVTPRHRVIPP